MIHIPRISNFFVHRGLSSIPLCSSYRSHGKRFQVGPGQLRLRRLIALAVFLWSPGFCQRAGLPMGRDIARSCTSKMTWCAGFLTPPWHSLTQDVPSAGKIARADGEPTKCEFRWPIRLHQLRLRLLRFGEATAAAHSET